MSNDNPQDPERIGRRSRALEALAQLGTIEIDLESGVARASEEAHRLLGVTSLIGLRPLLRHLWPASRRELLEALQIACTHGGTSYCEIDVIGGRRIHCRFGPLTEDSERGRTVLAVLRDVSDEHYGSLGRSRAVSRSMQMAGIGSWAIDVRANRLEWTEEVFRIHDLPIGDTPTVEEAISFYPPEAAALVERGLADAIAGRGPYDFELPLVTAKGRHVWVHTHGDVELDDHGVPLRIFGTFQDITVRRAARELARRNEERLALALEGAQDGVWD